jgi:hypothetical protein
MTKVTLMDAKDCLKLGTSYLATHSLPQSLWPALAELLAAGDLLVKRRYNQRYLSFLTRYLEPCLENAPLRRILRRSIAESYLERLVGMADLQGDRWHPDCRVLGAEVLSSAVEAGKGAILWIAPMGFAANVPKIALYKLGYPLCHLSASEHGISQSDFARRHLNPLIVKTENRYLAERVVLDDARAPNSFLRLVAHLRKNRLVSIRLTDNARKYLRFPILAGSILVPLGPIALARMTGAPLHPLITVKTGKKSFDLHILPALPTNESHDEQGQNILVGREFVRSLEEFALAYPAFWRGWWLMRRAEKSGLEIVPAPAAGPKRAPRPSTAYRAELHRQALLET